MTGEYNAVPDDPQHHNYLAHFRRKKQPPDKPVVDWQRYIGIDRPWNIVRSRTRFTQRRVCCSDLLETNEPKRQRDLDGHLE